MSDNMKEAIEKKKVKSKKEDKKYFIIFLVIMALSFVVGYGAGRIIGKVKKMDIDFSSIAEPVKEVAIYAIPTLCIVMNIILVIVAVITVHKSKIQFATWDGEEEELPDRIDSKLGAVLTASNIISIISFFLFAVAINLDITTEMSDLTEKIIGIVNITLLFRLQQIHV